MNKIEVSIVRSPSVDDWCRCRYLALSTAGKRASGLVQDDWKHKILKAGHSPIRTLWWTIEIRNLPYWVSTHLVRHKIGIEHYVRSQRNDRQSEYDRNAARQDMPVTHVLEINAQALMQLCRMRLCMKAAPETRAVVEAIRDAVLITNPEFSGLLAPTCERYGTCDEMYPCGKL